MEGGVADRPSTLYRLGGVAVFLTLVLYVSQFVFIPWDDYPASTEQWFALFVRSRLLGVMLLALRTALRSAGPSWTAAGGLFWFPYWLLMGLGLLRSTCSPVKVERCPLKK